MDAIAVSLDGATVRLGHHLALDGFTGSFDPGTVTALIGGDGAGKSTLLKLLAGRLATNSGTRSGLPVDPKDIGYQPADSGTWRGLSIRENIEFVGRAYGLSTAQRRSRATELLELAGLDQVQDRLVSRLSGGMRQKLGVVLATMHQPGLVLLDEPTTGVDPISRAELWSLITSAAVEGATVVFATTYLDEAERASKLFLLGDGKLLASGTPDEVIALTPGSVLQSPVENEVARQALISPRAWRRAETVYLWQPPSGDTAPVGFTPAARDLENTSIALLLEAGADTTIPVTSEDFPAVASKSDPLAQALEVTRVYGDFAALREVSLEVRPGEIVGLLGGNGAGKTTLIRTLLGLETPTAGEALLCGSTPSLNTRQRIGYVAQGLGLYPSLSALENLQFAASVHACPISEPAVDFALALDRAPVSTLPLGTRRILAYLTATVHHPELLILDEPTSGMDSLGRARLWRELRALADRGVGILVTTHYMQEAAQCDHLVVLTSGSVTASGSIQEIVGSHQSLIVTTEHWEQAFSLLRDAGFPVLLDGRLIRVPGTRRDDVADTLHSLGEAVVLTEAPATLEETMLMAAREPAGQI